MAEDPAVDSIEVDCLERVDMFLPGTPDLDQAVARRLTVHNGAPCGALTASTVSMTTRMTTAT